MNTQYHAQHLNFSPSTPYTVPEFQVRLLTTLELSGYQSGKTDFFEQGGSFDPWGGYGFDQCGQLINHEQVRVFYKHMFSSDVKIFNLYMVCYYSKLVWQF